MKHHLLALALVASCHLQAQATEPGKSQTMTSPDQVPQGLTAADWSSIRSARSAGYAANAAGVTTQQAYVKPSNTGAGDQFGISVAVSGDTVVVGAYGEGSSTSGVDSSPNEAASDSGAAYVFVRSGGMWTQQAYLKASNPGTNDYFGYSVAVSGDTVVVGARLEDSSTTGVGSSPTEAAPNSGAAYVFIRSGGTWSQQAYLKASNTGANDSFGYSVAVSGDTVVVGAYLEASSTTGVGGSPDEMAPTSGAAYVFIRSGGIWGQQAYLKASNTTAGDNFGVSVAVSGDTVVVGAYGEDSSTTGVGSSPDEMAPTSGAAYVFIRSGGIWGQQAYLKASNTGANDNFGTSVAVSGETVVVGAFAEASSTTGVGSSPDETAPNSGAAYVFIRSGGTWSQQAYLKASNTGANDYFGTSVAVSGDTVVIGAKSEDSNAVGVGGNQADNSANSSGAAYVFVRSGATWSQQAYLKASATSAFDRNFGVSVAVSGSTIISGAHREDSITNGINSVPDLSSGDIDSGAAYIFTLPVAEPPVVVPPTVVKFRVTVKVSNTKLGKVTGIGSYTTGTKVTLKATPKKGRTFVGWYEKKKLVSKNKVLVIKKLTKSRSLVAKFK